MFIAKRGQIFDGSTASARIQRNTREQNARIKRGEVVHETKRRQKDVQARWTLKRGKAQYGYELHANTDWRCGFHRRCEVSAASVHERRHFETSLNESTPGARCGPTPLCQ